MTTTTTARPISASAVRLTRVWSGYHVWNIYLGSSRSSDILRLSVTRDGKDWVVGTKADISQSNPDEVVRVKSLAQAKVAAAWVYNDRNGAEQPSLSEVLEQVPARRKAASGVTPAEAGITVGTIFYSSWGYDQTQVDFYEVVGLTPKGVKIRKIGQSVEGAGFGSDKVSATKGRFLDDEVQTKMLRGSADSPYLSLTSYSSAWVWDGTPKYQTASGFGH